MAALDNEYDTKDKSKSLNQPQSIKRARAGCRLLPSALPQSQGTHCPGKTHILLKWTLQTSRGPFICRKEAVVRTQWWHYSLLLRDPCNREMASYHLKDGIGQKEKVNVVDPVVFSFKLRYQQTTYSTGFSLGHTKLK